jgi:1L-myo-inositol 1-phosphate cytidylyltransferase
MIRQAVILAAGKGSRIRTAEQSLPKPLHIVNGAPLIRRTVEALAAAGVTKVVVVVGFMAEAIRNAVATDAVLGHPQFGVQIEFVDNPEYEKSNGVSVMVAAGLLRGPFLLSMSDHVYDASVASAVAVADMTAADLYLAVDRRLADIYDIDDATKVATADDNIVNISKQLTVYDCIDCGVFAVSDRLVTELQDVYKMRGDCSLSDGVLQLARLGRARVVDIGEAFWQDVDTPEALVRAESELTKLGQR